MKKVLFLAVIALLVVACKWPSTESKSVPTDSTTISCADCPSDSAVSDSLVVDSASTDSI